MLNLSFSRSDARDIARCINLYHESIRLFQTQSLNENGDASPCASCIEALAVQHASDRLQRSLDLLSDEGLAQLVAIVPWYRRSSWQGYVEPREGFLAEDFEKEVSPVLEGLRLCHRSLIYARLCSGKGYFRAYGQLRAESFVSALGKILEDQQFLRLLSFSGDDAGEG